MTEITSHANFTTIRYAQCWEDADILLTALNIQPGDTCLSIASAGDNSLALLTQQPDRVIALDLNPAQLACLELRVAAYRELTHAELLGFLGSRPLDASQRRSLYHRCRADLSPPVQRFWDARPNAIEAGMSSAGKFENYFALFRRWMLPLVHSAHTVDRLLQGGTLEQRQSFYRQKWDTWQWRSLFRLFFSRWFMGRAGRDPSFFKYVQGSVADRILSRTQYALTQLNPADNPYLQWILTGAHPTALPYALRPEHFATIRANLDRLEWHCCSVETFLQDNPDVVIDRYNLSDIFEYMSLEATAQLLQQLVRTGRSGGRLVYWNMLAPRSRPETMADQLKPLSDLAQTLHAQDKAFFYSALHVEEIVSKPLTDCGKERRSFFPQSNLHEIES